MIKKNLPKKKIPKKKPPKVDIEWALIEVQAAIRNAARKNRNDNNIVSHHAFAVREHFALVAQEIAKKHDRDYEIIVSLMSGKMDSLQRENSRLIQKIKQLENGGPRFPESKYVGEGI